MNAPPPASRESLVLRVLPGLKLFRGYQASWLSSDLLAGVSVCIVMIPSVIAYAGLMGLPPQNGLYAALIPLLIYPWFGSSRQVIVGPDIAISLLVASSIGPLVGGVSQAPALASLVALITGVLLLVGARFKIGAVADFLSKPVLVGYMTGAALILICSQLDKLFGVQLEKSDFFPRLIELGGKLHQTHLPTFSFGMALLALTLLCRKFIPKFPVALLAFVVAIPASVFLGLEAKGIKTVGAFPSGLPAFTIPGADWHEIHALLPAAMGIALLTYTEGILLARAFAARHSYDVDANQELTALGLADFIGSFFQGFPITGSQARTTINDSAGAKTQLSSLLTAATLALFMLFLSPLVARMPLVALAVLLIYGGFTLVEFDVMVRIYRFYPRSSLLAGVTTLAVLAAGVIPGILVGVALSLLGLINRISHPPDAVLREVPGHGFHDLGSPQPAETRPGFIAYRFYAPLLFSNAGYFLSRVRHLVAQSPTPVKWFLLDAQAITALDVTAAECLYNLMKELGEKGIALKFAHANRPLKELCEHIGLKKQVGPDSFFDSVHECAQAFEVSSSRG